MGNQGKMERNSKVLTTAKHQPLRPTPCYFSLINNFRTLFCSHLDRIHCTIWRGRVMGGTNLHCEVTNFLICSAHIMLSYSLLGYGEIYHKKLQDNATDIIKSRANLLVTDSVT